MFLKINESEISQVKTNGYNLDFDMQKVKSFLMYTIKIQSLMEFTF